MTNKNLIIINNEKIFEENNNFYCDNLDLKVLPEGLSQYFNVEYIVRKSSAKGKQKINFKNIINAPNIFKFLYFVFKSLKKPKATYLIISITPYTFLSFLILFLFRKKIFIYLFSSGHEEYKHILGSWFVWIYHIMYLIVTAYSNVIVCHERLFKSKKSNLVFISRLDDDWIANHKKPLLDKVRYLYVGRMSPEKGVFDFIKMFNNIKFNAEFFIAGNTKNENIKNKNIKFLGYITDPKNLMDAYDNSNIMILPSYTEATPYVVDESLARKRPVIIFDDISYIVRDKKGVFVSKRDVESFSQTTKYIMDNYLEIQKNMEKNILPTKKDMIKQISDIINLEN